MTDKYTPGPWAAIGTDVKTPGPRSRILCWTGLPEIALDEARANARLIAAAPDLLAALQALVALSDHLDPEGLFQGLEYINARQAIAKATNA